MSDKPAGWVMMGVIAQVMEEEGLGVPEAFARQPGSFAALVREAFKVYGYDSQLPRSAVQLSSKEFFQIFDYIWTRLCPSGNVPERKFTWNEAGANKLKPSRPYIYAVIGGATALVLYVYCSPFILKTINFLFR